MAKEKYVVKTELETSQSLKNAKQLQKEINEIGRVAKSASKNAKITGSVKMENKAIKETERALGLAKKNVDNLTKALSQAKLNGATSKQVGDLEGQLRKAQISANNLESELHSINRAQPNLSGWGKIKQTMSNGVQSAKGFGSTLLDVGSKFSMIGTFASTAISGITNLFSGLGNKVLGFGQLLMDTYDKQLAGQKALTATLSNGANGYDNFIKHIDSGSRLLKSQKNDLMELASMVSGYIQVSGDEAFKIVDSINTIGDSLGLSMDQQKQFTYGLSQALGAGALHAQDFNQIMQTTLGSQFRDVLIQASNELDNSGVTLENFKQKMEEGAFNTRVMNRALELFQQKAQETANSGQLSFTQIREMVDNGFRTSALEGFQTQLESVGFSMGDFGNTATDLSMVVGQKMGEMAGYAVNSLIKIMDTNGDGKVSNEELQKAFEKVSDKVVDAYEGVRDFIRQINWSDVSGFISDIGSIISSLSDLIGWIQDTISWFDRMFDKKRMADNIAAAGGHSGSGGGRGWLVNPNNTNDWLQQDTLSEKIYGSMNKPLGMHLQLFGNYDKAITQTLQNLPQGLNGSVSNTTQSSVSYDNSRQDVNINVYGNDGAKIANDIYKRLERNGVKLTKR
ncbi:hypothetical protein LG75P1_00040 [Lactococcus phage LG75P1]|nr:hypothetical protein LG75P1_00040 [Lactococcus phage LG75P1]WAX16764.1 hypothetical protein LG75P3_00040 [Lactococcus phage LG75P3]